MLKSNATRTSQTNAVQRSRKESSIGNESLTKQDITFKGSLRGPQSSLNSLGQLVAPDIRARIVNQSQTKTSPFTSQRQTNIIGELVKQAKMDNMKKVGLSRTGLSSKAANTGFMRNMGHFDGVPMQPNQTTTAFSLNQSNKINFTMGSNFKHSRHYMSGNQMGGLHMSGQKQTPQKTVIQVASQFGKPKLN